MGAPAAHSEHVFFRKILRISAKIRRQAIVVLDSRARLHRNVAELRAYAVGARRRAGSGGDWAERVRPSTAACNGPYIVASVCPDPNRRILLAPNQLRSTAWRSPATGGDSGNHGAVVDTSQRAVPTNATRPCGTTTLCAQPRAQGSLQLFRHHRQRRCTLTSAPRGRTDLVQVTGATQQ